MQVGLWVVQQTEPDFRVTRNAGQQRRQQIQRVAGVADIQYVARVVDGFHRFALQGHSVFIQPHCSQ